MEKTHSPSARAGGEPTLVIARFIRALASYTNRLY